MTLEINISIDKLKVTSENYPSIEENGYLIVWPIFGYSFTQRLLDLIRENSYGRWS